MWVCVRPRTHTHSYYYILLITNFTIFLLGQMGAFLWHFEKLAIYFVYIFKTINKFFFVVWFRWIFVEKSSKCKHFLQIFWEFLGLCWWRLLGLKPPPNWVGVFVKLCKGWKNFTEVYMLKLALRVKKASKFQ